MIVLYIVLALVMGMSVAFQGTVNSSLATKIGTGETLLINSVVVMICALVAFFVLLDPTRLSWAHLTKAPAVAYTGGLLGFVIIILAIVLFPRLGAGLTLALAIAAQLVTAVAIDHWGVMGVEVHSFNLPRLVGIVLMIGGVALIKIF